MKKFQSSNINETISIEEVKYPQYYEVKGCGSHHINGIYSFKGICNDRPYYIKEEDQSTLISPSLWYFKTNLFPSSYWCGWYISKSVSSSSSLFLSFS